MAYYSDHGTSSLFLNVLIKTAICSESKSVIKTCSHLNNGCWRVSQLQIDMTCRSCQVQKCEKSSHLLSLRLTRNGNSKNDY